MERLARCLLVAFACTLFLLSCFSSGECATVGGPVEADKPLGPGVASKYFDTYEAGNGFITVGAEADILFKRRLGGMGAAEGSGDLKGQRHMAKIAYSIYDRIEPYVKAGISQLETEWNSLGTKVELEADRELAWAVGLKATLWNIEDWGVKLISDTQFSRSDPGVDVVHIEGVRYTPSSGTFKLSEWQGALLASKEILNPGLFGSFSIVPYTGIKYSDIVLDASVNTTERGGFNIGSANSDHVFGIVLGCDLIAEQHGSLSLEGRFLDEQAVSAVTTLRF